MKRPDIATLGEPPSPERSALMSRVRVRNTELERLVTSLLRVLGHKFIRNSRRLPGSPDIVINKQRKAIFVHGCFWHGHTECAKGTTRPKTRPEFWQNKISANMARDRRVITELKQLGWKALTIWECQLRDTEAVTAALSRFLKTPSNRGANCGN
jgi:DNA mismatch endonuclease, patch repair protein